MSEELKNRREIIFLYDVTDANPNGDPVDENKPRIDEETGINFVTDVRLKRTIRDYLLAYSDEDIFIQEIREEDGNLKTKEEQLKKYQNSEELLLHCIDVRLFGATTAVKGKTMTLTGPVQFKYGRSLHGVDMKYIKGTTVMPSREGREQGTFTEKYILPYSLIAFYGVVNENAASAQGIQLSAHDIYLLLEGIWNGTKELMSTSKTGQMPRLLIEVVHKEKDHHFGELDKRISFSSAKRDEEIRDISEGNIEINKLSELIKKHADKIEQINYCVDDRVNLTLDGKKITIDEAFKAVNPVPLNF